MIQHKTKTIVCDECRLLWIGWSRRSPRNLTRDRERETFRWARSEVKEIFWRKNWRSLEIHFGNVNVCLTIDRSTINAEHTKTQAAFNETYYNKLFGNDYALRALSVVSMSSESTSIREMMVCGCAGAQLNAAWLTLRLSSMGLRWIFSSFE